MSELTDKLRESGPFLASDGLISVRVISSEFIHEAADELDRLQIELNKLNTEYLELYESSEINLDICEALMDVVKYSRHRLDCQNIIKCSCGFLNAVRIVQELNPVKSQ